MIYLHAKTGRTATPIEHETLGLRYKVSAVNSEPSYFIAPPDIIEDCTDWAPVQYEGIAIKTVDAAKYIFPK